MPDHPVPLTPQYYLAEIATSEELLVQVFQSDFQDALRHLVPSVSQSELGHYFKVQKQFSSSVVDVS
jgi:peroxin-6